MRTSKTLWIANLAVAALACAGVRAADGATAYKSKPGTNNIVRIEGTSTMHDWHVVSKIIAGSLELGPEFSPDPAKAKAGAKIPAKATLQIPVKSLKSVQKDGTPYSNAMDNIMYEKLLADQFRAISYTLTELVLKEAPKDAAGPFLFDTKGDLAVAGVTNNLSIPVEMTVDGKNLKFAGKISLKMTEFKIEPPAPAIAGGMIKTGDEVHLSLEWNATPK